MTDADAESVRRLRDFVAAHGGSGTAVVAHIGRVGARVVVVGQDGAFADVVVSSVGVANRVCEQAGIPVGQWDTELTALMSPSPRDRLRMRGTGR